MLSFPIRLFFRIISKSREVYLLKIISMGIAFACATLIILFSLHEFGYDRFHRDHHCIFRILQRNNSEAHNGNRLSNRIPFEVFSVLKSEPTDSISFSRVKIMEDLDIIVANKTFRNQKIHAADPEITKIFSFEILTGTLNDFSNNKRSGILSASTALQIFGTTHAAGKEFKVTALSDTLLFSVAAVYKDFPQNSHEQFNMFVGFDTLSIQALSFNSEDAGVYGKISHPDRGYLESIRNKIPLSGGLTYEFQRLSEIYFGPRVSGEDAMHGDYYSITILISITALILFLALTSFINLTTLSLPYRSKEIAIKKLAGTSQEDLIIGFTIESFMIVGISAALGIALLVLTANSIEQFLSINLISLMLGGNVLLLLIWTGLFAVFAIPPVFMTLKFTHATPNRLLSTDTITFPRFKRIIMFLQLGISIFLIVSSLVIRRQINYSLLKEPGRNHDQVVYLSYPKDLTNEGLRNMRLAWQKNNANILDVIATSQLPDQITSKELNSPFYQISVDPVFAEFFGLRMIRGNWFKANDGDSVIVVNEKAAKLLGNNPSHVIGVFEDISGQFNQPGKPVKINIAPYFNYNFLCVRILEVDVRRTVRYLSTYFEKGSAKPSISFLNKNFAEWLQYQDKLNTLSEIVAIISAFLSCCAIYGLSLSIVRDKLKQIALHKLFGANTLNITRLLVQEFTRQMLIAILIFGPLTYITLKELLRNFVYSTDLNWSDPIFPVAYCCFIIFLLCGLQARSLSREDLSTALKG